MNGSWPAIARSSQRFIKALFLYRLFVGLHRTVIIIKPQNRSAFLEKYDRPSTTLYPRSCSLYWVRGKSVGWSILDLTWACECDVALERYCSCFLFTIFLLALSASLMSRWQFMMHPLAINYKLYFYGLLNYGILQKKVSSASRSVCEGSRTVREGSFERNIATNFKLHA